MTMARTGTAGKMPTTDAVPKLQGRGCLAKAGDDPESTKSAARNLKEVHKMNIDTMNEKVKELRELRRMQEDLAAEITSIEEELKGHMDRCGMDTLLGMDWRITWKSVTSKRLDTAALRKAMPDVASAFTRETTTRRFVLA